MLRPSLELHRRQRANGARLNEADFGPSGTDRRSLALSLL